MRSDARIAVRRTDVRRGAESSTNDSVRIYMTRLDILVANGGNHVRDTIRRSFDDQRFEVVSGSTTSEALRLVATGRLDLVITCLQVRRAGDGFTLVAAIRHLRPEARIVAVSDSLDTQGAMMAIGLQVDVIVTPFNVGRVANLTFPHGVRLNSPPTSEIEQRVANDNRRLA